MNPDLDSLIAKARAQQKPAEPLAEAFNQRVWRQIHMSQDIRSQSRWSFGLLLSNPAFGLGCLLLAVVVGVSFGLGVATLKPDSREVHNDLSVFGAAPPSLPSTLLHHQ
jgi:hypothetical protein